MNQLQLENLQINETKTKEIELLQKELDEKQQSLQSELDKNQNLKQKYDKSKTKSKVKLDKLQQDKDNLETQLNQANQDKSHLENQFQESEKQCLEIEQNSRNHIKKLKEENKSLQQDKQALEQKNYQLQEQINQLTSEDQNKEDYIQNLTSQLQNAQQESKSYEEQMLNLLEQLNQKELNLEQKESNLSQDNLNQDFQNNKIEESEGLQAQLFQNSQELQFQIEQKNQEVSQKENRIDELEEQLKKLQEDLNQKENQLQTMQQIQIQENEKNSLFNNQQSDSCLILETKKEEFQSLENLEQERKNQEILKIEDVTQEDFQIEIQSQESQNQENQCENITFASVKNQENIYQETQTQKDLIQETLKQEEPNKEDSRQITSVDLRFEGKTEKELMNQSFFTANSQDSCQQDPVENQVDLQKKDNQELQIQLQLQYLTGQNLDLQRNVRNLKTNLQNLEKEKEKLEIQLDFFKQEQINFQDKFEKSRNKKRKLILQLLQKDKEIQELQITIQNLREASKLNEQNENNQIIQNNANQGEQIGDQQILINQELNMMPQNIDQIQSSLELKQVYARRSLVNLLNEYMHNANIQEVIKDLQQNYDSYRRIRGDGNCYFRAVGFSYLEHLIRYTTPVQHLEDFINKLSSDIGYYKVRSNTQNLSAIILNLLNKLKERKEKNDASIQQFLVEELEENKDNQDEALVWQMRCLSANYLEIHQDYFENFSQIPYNQVIKNVLTMGKEVDGIGVGPLQVVLKVQIKIATIDRNYTEAITFDQMKIAGKCPLIFILYKPGHYDIIYTQDQSNADGFNSQSEQYTKQTKLPNNYDIHNPDKPFFIEIQANGQECPIDEYKIFQIQYDFPYVSTYEASQQAMNFQKIEQEKTVFETCIVCQQQIESAQFVQLQCNHKICNYCMCDQIQNNTGGMMIFNNEEAGQRASCITCKRILTEQEIESIIGKEKFEKAKEEANQRLLQ